MKIIHSNKVLGIDTPSILNQSIKLFTALNSESKLSNKNNQNSPQNKRNLKFNINRQDEIQENKKQNFK